MISHHIIATISTAGSLYFSVTNNYPSNPPKAVTKNGPNTRQY